MAKLSPKAQQRLNLALIIIFTVVPVVSIVILGLALGGVFDEHLANPCPVKTVVTQPPQNPSPSVSMYQPAATPDYCKTHG